MKADPNVRDIPRAEAVERVNKLLADNAKTLPQSYVEVYFKFTCEQCGERCTLEEADKIYERGMCCECGHETPLTMVGFALIYHNLGAVHG